MLATPFRLRVQPNEGRGWGVGSFGASGPPLGPFFRYPRGGGPAVRSGKKGGRWLTPSPASSPHRPLTGGGGGEGVPSAVRQAPSAAAALVLPQAGELLLQAPAPRLPPLPLLRTARAERRTGGSTARCALEGRT